MKHLLLPSLLLLSVNAYGQQQATEILQRVEQNNATLQAAALRTETARQETRLESSLDDPEIGFDYLWGKPGTIGYRRDVSIRQNFDLGILFGYRRRLAHSQQELLDLGLEEQRLQMQLQTLDLLVQLTCLNQQQQLYDERLQQEQLLAKAYEQRLQTGDASKLEVNRIRLELADIEAANERLQADRQQLVISLQTLTGDLNSDYAETSYLPLLQLPIGSLRTLREAQMQQQQVVADADVKATRAQSLPSLSAGYMAELTDEEKWHGITFGITLPLWSNRHNLRRARLEQQSVRAEAADARFQLEQATAAQRLRCDRYQSITQRLQKRLASASPLTMLRRALDEGEISLIEYTLEASDLFDLRIEAIEAERDYQLARLQYEALSWGEVHEQGQ